MKRSFYIWNLSLMEWTLITSIIAIILTFLLSACEGSSRSKVSQVKSDQRTMATALEAYYVDQNAFPPYIREGGDYILGHHLTTPQNYLDIDNLDPFKFIEYSNIFELVWAKFGNIIVIGILVIISVSVFLYTTKPEYWKLEKLLPDIIVPGIVILCLMIALFHNTDQDFIGYKQILPEWRGKYLGVRYYSDANGWIIISVGPDHDYDIDPEKYYNSSIAQPSFELLCIAGVYDPTNGTVSSGDVFRVKQ